MKPRAHTQMLKHRLEWGFCGLAAVFLFLAYRMFYIQVTHHAFYQQQAERYHVQRITVEPARGVLLDCKGAPLAQNLPRKSVYADPRFVDDPAATARPLAAVLRMDAGDIEASLRNKSTFVWLKRQVDSATQEAVSSLSLAGVRIIEDKESPGGARRRHPVFNRSICADPRRVADARAAASRLAPLLQLPAQDVEKRLTRRRSFVWLKRRVDAQTEAAVRALNLKGVDFVSETRRQYPFKQLAANLIGYTNIDGEGIEGLEKQLDDTISGRPGSMLAEVDALGRIIPGTVREREDVVDGYNVTLTLNSRIQHLTEAAIEKAFTTYQAAGVCAVVLDPQTGAILAMASRPTYDPNRPAESEGDSRRNRCVTDSYEPGSTLKSITIAAALEEKAISPSSYFHCAGTYPIGKRRIRCVLHGDYKHGHGTQTITGILRESCNIGTAQIGARLGSNKLYRYLADFGFIGDTRARLIGEQRGSLTPPDTWPNIKLANVAFGQGIAVTPLQVAVAYAAIANGGNVMQPYLIRKVEDADGRVIQEYQPRMIRQVISPETARTITNCLKIVVEEGTGKPARVNGYAVAGKTGSAQKAENGRYAPGKFVASFVGYAPADDPRVVAIVVVDEPRGSHWGATCAAPAFQQIIEGSLWHLKVTPDRPVDLQRVALGRR